MDPCHLGAKSDPVWDLAGKRLTDPPHAADRLEHRRLEVVERETLQAPPKARGQDVVQPYRLAIQRLRIEAAAGIPCMAAERRGHVARPVTKVAVEAAMRAQRLEQNLLVFPGHRLVERALAGRLRQEFGDRALEVGLDLPDPARLAVERIGRMKKRIVVELYERLERHAESATIVKDRMVVVGNSPGPRIEIKALIERAVLGSAAKFDVSVAAAN